MLKKTLAALLALTLLIGCLPALSLADEKPRSFVPQQLVAAFNDAVEFTLANVEGMTQDDRDGLSAFMLLFYTESTEEGAAFFDNENWSIELAGQYGKRIPDVSQSADSVHLTLHEEGLDEQKMLLARVALAFAIRSCDPGVDFDALYAWITTASESGERFEMDGCYLELMRVDEMWIYNLNSSASGIALDDSDALKSLLSDHIDDVASGEADSDIAPTPTPEAEIRPEPISEPTPTPDPDMLVDWNGFSAKLLRAEYDVSADGDIDLLLYCRCINQSGRDLNIFVDDASIDGVPVSSVGMPYMTDGLDTGEDSYERITLTADEDGDYEAGLEAICNPGTLNATVNIADMMTNEVLHTQPLTVSLSDIPRFSPTPEPTPTPNSDLLVDWNGFSAELLRIEPYAFTDGTVIIWFYCRFINDTDRKIDMFIDDAQVDGVPVEGIGKMSIESGTDTGLDSEESFFIQPDQDNDYDAGMQAVCNARRLDATIRLSCNGETLYTQPFSISLLSVPSFTPRATTEPTPVPATYYYDTLSRGDTGDDVAWMQMELIDLGYLLGEADSVFGAKTAEAVRLFNEANGFGSSEIATPEMQYCLYGNGPVPYEEPWIPLLLTDSARCEWKRKTGNNLVIRMEVTNCSRNRTIKAFELYMWAYDVYGDCIHGDTYYYETTTKKVKPGKTVKSDYFNIPNKDQIDKVAFAVSKVVFEDGTVHEADELQRWYSNSLDF